MTTHSPLTLSHVPLSELRPDQKNPRKHSKKQIGQIAESIRQFGFVVPILADGAGSIIAGHGRWLAAKELGMAHVPCIRVEHLSPAQIRALMIADNKLTENAAWDMDLLKEHFLDLSGLTLDFDLEITGFETAEIDLMLQEEDAEEEEPELPPLAQQAISREGDLWLLGEHRLLCGNSLDASNYRTLMQGKQASMIFTDPPYNVPVQGHVTGQDQHREFAMASGEMSPEAFTQFLQKVFGLMATHSTDGSLHYICMDWRHMAELLDAGKIYTKFQNLCVWVKHNGGMGSFYRSRHELVFVFKQGNAAHKNNVELGSHGRYRTNVWEYDGANSFGRNGEEGNLLEHHPTPKPVQMVADAILDCTQRGNIILDPFLGSGSTLMAAERVHRICYGIEIDPLYVDLTLRRFQQWTGQEPVHAESGLTFGAYSHHMQAEADALAMKPASKQKARSTSASKVASASAPKPRNRKKAWR